MNLTGKDKQGIKVKEWKNVFQVNGTPKQARVGLCIFNKADYKLKLEKKNQLQMHKSQCKMKQQSSWLSLKRQLH
jgi:hypothetical protein